MTHTTWGELMKYLHKHLRCRVIFSSSAQHELNYGGQEAEWKTFLVLKKSREVSATVSKLYRLVLISLSWNNRYVVTKRLSQGRRSEINWTAVIFLGKGMARRGMQAGVGLGRIKFGFDLKNVENPNQDLQKKIPAKAFNQPGPTWSNFSFSNFSFRSFTISRKILSTESFLNIFLQSIRADCWWENTWLAGTFFCHTNA